MTPTGAALPPRFTTLVQKAPERVKNPLSA